MGALLGGEALAQGGEDDGFGLIGVGFDRGPRPPPRRRGILAPSAPLLRDVNVFAPPLGAQTDEVGSRGRIVEDLADLVLNFA
jgi:hypothetical protein